MIYKNERGLGPIPAKGHKTSPDSTPDVTSKRRNESEKRKQKEVKGNYDTVSLSLLRSSAGCKLGSRKRDLGNFTDNLHIIILSISPVLISRELLAES